MLDVTIVHGQPTSASDMREAFSEVPPKALKLPDAALVTAISKAYSLHIEESVRQAVQRRDSEGE